MSSAGTLTGGEGGIVLHLNRQFSEKLQESMASVLPITAIVLLLSFTLAPMPNGTLLLFLLGAAMLITGLLQPLLQKIPAWAGLVVSLLLFAATYHTQDGFWQLGPWQILLPGAWYANLFTAFFGFFPRGFFSTDYFPLLPWLFLFWAGYFLHFCMGRARMEPLRRSVCAPLGWLGRHSLGIYLLHQPVLYAALVLLPTIL